MTLRLYNTLSRKVEEFVPVHPPVVTMYNCGPTVYNYPQIGNLRSYVFADILRRTLEHSGYKVEQVINITDVGHLVSDEDEGEDKIELGARREGKHVEEIIAQYSDAFYNDLKALNIFAAGDRGNEAKFPRATHHIAEQIALIETLHTKGYTYETSDGIYFDTSKFPRYPDFARLDIAGMQAGVRVAVGEKKNSTDFALWKFSPSDLPAQAGGKQREQEWDSPLGIDRKGFPGWHIECSAMAMKYLGETIDIHTGGIDHIPVHHTNEIAQSECATGKPFARFWMHNAFVNVDGQKMSKSLGNVYTLKDLAEHGISPLAYRYWLLTAHYRTQVNFTWDAMEGAQHAFERTNNIIKDLSTERGDIIEQYKKRFIDSLNNDLNTAEAIATLWELLRNRRITDKDKLATALWMDKVLGLGFEELRRILAESSAPSIVLELLQQRERARRSKLFAESDRLRDEIKKLDYEVKDTPDGQKLEKI